MCDILVLEKISDQIFYHADKVLNREVLLPFWLYMKWAHVISRFLIRWLLYKRAYFIN